MTQTPPPTPPGESAPATPPAAEAVLGASAATAAAPSPNPLSRLSTQMIVALAAVVVVVLSGIGVLVGQALSSDKKPTAVPVTLPPTPTPTTPPTTPTPTPTTTPPTTTPPSSGSVTLANGAVTVPVLSGWTSHESDDETGVSLSSNCCYVFVGIGHGTNVDPSTVVTNDVQSWLTGQNGYSQVSTGGTPQAVGGAQGLGKLTASAEVSYQAAWTGSGGSEDDFGIIFAFVRSDGSVLEMQMEAAGTSFDDAHTNYVNAADLQAILNQTVTNFAGS